VSLSISRLITGGKYGHEVAVAHTSLVGHSEDRQGSPSGQASVWRRVPGGSNSESEGGQGTLEEKKDLSDVA